MLRAFVMLIATAALAAALPASAQAPLPAHIFLDVTEDYVSIYGKGGPKGENFKMPGRRDFASQNGALYGGDFASSCEGTPAAYVYGTSPYLRFVYRFGETIDADFTCKAVLGRPLNVKLKTSAKREGNLLVMTARADYARGDGKLKGYATEEMELEISGKNCVVKKYRRYEESDELSDYSTRRERQDSAKAGDKCVVW